MLPPNNYFNRSMALTTLPQTWFDVVQSKGKIAKGTILVPYKKKSQVEVTVDHGDKSDRK